MDNISKKASKKKIKRPKRRNLDNKAKPKKRAKFCKKGSKEPTELDIKLSNIKEKILLIIVAFFVMYNVIIIYQRVTNPKEIPNFFGYKTFVVSSGSMEPTLNVGDLIITTGKDLQIEKGDIITYFDNEDTVVTHRVIEVIEENGKVKYKTKGDSNTTIDKYFVSIEDIEGKYIRRIPFIGWAVNVIQTREGIILTSIILFAIYWYIKSSEEDEEEWEQLLDDLKS